ncbi:MAG: hypothetical protein KAY22_12470 [Rhizorhabdus sp.]|uniref:hypothetical protein n=1 Tax=Rhizorhabdus sp. TaxID=1968843 RepID=UPI001B5ACA89|nr:hypothetical protein [Rhizorhabdus sp.]MBP8233113.1 hypothetical protein [Rhizorhabdus sp.]
MSVRLMEQVWDMDIGATDRLVLLRLAWLADGHGVARTTIKGRRGLSPATGLGVRAVQYAIRSLVDAGHLQRLEQPGLGAEYHLRLDMLGGRS